VPAGFHQVRLRVGETTGAAAVRCDEVQLEPAGGLRGNGDRGAVGRPVECVVADPGRACQGPDRTGLDIDDAKLVTAVVAVRYEDVRDQRAVGRDDRTLLVAVRIEVAVVAREALGPGLVDRDDGEAIAAVALGRDDEPVVAEPDRAARRGGPPATGTRQTQPSSP